MLGAFVVVTALLIGATIMARQNPLFRLGRYEKTLGFSDYVTHMVKRSGRSSSSELLELAYPMSRDYEFMISCQMNVRGQFGWGKLHPGRAGRMYSAQQKLTPAQLTKIRQLMRDLPPSSAPTDRWDVLGVVLDDSISTPAQIRLYDRRHPPAQITEICHILKMPLDLTQYG